MRVSIDWESTYRYSVPVRLLHTELRVLPANGFGQRLREGTITLTPTATPSPLRDMLGNTYHHVDFLEEIDHFSVAIHALVNTAPPTADGTNATDAVSPLLRHLYLSATERAPHDPAIVAIADDADVTAADPLAAGWALCQLISERFVFEVGSTNVATTARDLRGVCQDFSHLMLAALRARGIPARYVSGYLAPHEGAESSQASHAWVQIHANDRWYGFDPANNASQDERYVVTAVGRDYDDVPPIRGTFAGVATEEWHTTLRVHSNRAQQQ